MYSINWLLKAAGLSPAIRAPFGTFVLAESVQATTILTRKPADVAKWQTQRT